MRADEANELKALLKEQQDLMIRVGRYEVEIKDEVVAQEYTDRRDTIRRKLRQLNLDDPNPHIDLWDWYRYWKRNGLDSWAERDDYVRDLYRDLYLAVEAMEDEQLQKTPEGEDALDPTPKRPSFAPRAVGYIYEHYVKAIIIGVTVGLLVLAILRAMGIEPP